MKIELERLILGLLMVWHKKLSILHKHLFLFVCFCVFFLLLLLLFFFLGGGGGGDTIISARKKKNDQSILPIITHFGRS